MVEVTNPTPIMKTKFLGSLIVLALFAAFIKSPPWTRRSRIRGA
jgi:hypothetical protein